VKQSLVSPRPDGTLVEYQAPQDFFNASASIPFGPSPRLGRPHSHRPGNRSPALRKYPSENLSKEALESLPYAFQFLMANEIPGEYDYLMITCGPVSLADRIANPQPPSIVPMETRFTGRGGEHRQCVAGRNVSRPDRFDTAPARQLQPGALSSACDGRESPRLSEGLPAQTRGDAEGRT